MIEKDTVRLLRECDSGVKMGVAAIDDVIDKVKNEKFREKLIDLNLEPIQYLFYVRVVLQKFKHRLLKRWTPRIYAEIGHTYPDIL